MDELIESDFTLEKEISLVNHEFDTISRELMTLFLEISQTMASLSQEAIATSEQLRESIQRQFIISVVIAFITLLFIVLFRFIAIPRILLLLYLVTHSIYQDYTLVNSCS